MTEYICALLARIAALWTRPTIQDRTEFDEDWESPLAKYVSDQREDWW